MRGFTLSDNARRKSGIGIAVDLGGEWSPLLWESTKARLGTAIHRLEYGGFAPRLSYIYVSQQSSIALYRFSRNQVQLGLTRQF